ncbi:MAG: class A beta-lactamase [Streptosporangiales bacterium]|nr:class A beta-lactamase [Streptosporangiales bacterium]
MPSPPPVSRRSLLKAGLAVSTVGVLVPSCAAAMAEPDVPRRLRAIERRYETRLGVYARNVDTGETVRYRSGERFAMCSAFKGLLAAHVLRDYDRHGEYLERVIHYSKDDLLDWSVVTENHVDTGMAVRDLCLAAVSHSDNAATNLLLRETDGPHGLTKFCRTIGDGHTRLDRREPDMSSAKPGDPRDTTTPAAIGRSYARLVLGDVLRPAHRDQLTSWLKVNTTSEPRFHAGLPDDWVIGDKTGTGGYGTVNDVGIVWTPKGTTLVLAVMSTKEINGATADDRVVADTARLLARVLAPGE